MTIEEILHLYLHEPSDSDHRDGLTTEQATAQINGLIDQAYKKGYIDASIHEVTKTCGVCGSSALV